MNHLVSFSGGLCSFWASDRLVKKYGPGAVTNLFADTLIEDPDLYRFNTEASEYLGVPLTRICEGRTPWQVFRAEHAMGNTHTDICSRILKREFLWSWINGNRFTFGPGRTIVYLGMDFSEYSRLAGVRAHNPDWQIEAPMCEEPLWDKARMIAECIKIGIRPPRLYKFGFPHNNCGGFCVKAGISHFVHLLRLRQLKAIRRRRSMGWHIVRCLLCKQKHIGRGVVEAISNPKCRKCRQEFDFGDFVKVVELTGRGRIKSLYCPNCDAHVMGDLKLDNYDPAEELTTV